MFATLARILVAMFLAGAIAAPAAYATGATSSVSPGDSTLTLLESIQSVRIGTQAAVITLKRGRRAHPIVIDYGDILQPGTSSGPAGAPGERAVPKGLSLGQIGGVLLGLTLFSRVIRVVRQVVPVRHR